MSSGPTTSQTTTADPATRFGVMAMQTFDLVEQPDSADMIAARLEIAGRWLQTVAAAER